MLLLLAQLAVGVVLPLAHGAGPGASEAHVEASGHAGCHSEAACAVCRLADARFHHALPISGADGALPVLAVLLLPAGVHAGRHSNFPAAPVRGPPA